MKYDFIMISDKMKLLLRGFYDPRVQESIQLQIVICKRNLLPFNGYDSFRCKTEFLVLTNGNGFYFDK